MLKIAIDKWNDRLTLRDDPRQVSAHSNKSSFFRSFFCFPYQFFLSHCVVLLWNDITSESFSITSLNCWVSRLLRLHQITLWASIKSHNSLTYDVYVCDVPLNHSCHDRIRLLLRFYSAQRYSPVKLLALFSNVCTIFRCRCFIY